MSLLALERPRTVLISTDDGVETGITALLPAADLVPALELPVDLAVVGAPVDDVALAAITELYREIMPEGGAVLDVMSSWIGHLPPEIDYRKVVGIGVDACILAENPFLDEWRVQDLNQNRCCRLATASSTARQSAAQSSI